MKMENSRISEVQLEIATDCALRCIHCSSVFSSHLPVGYSRSELFFFLNSLPGKKLVFFTGGEPIMNPELGDYIKDCKKIGDSTVGLFSSGIKGCNGNQKSLSKDEASLLANIGLGLVYLSFFHVVPEKHDFFTGQKGSFFLTRETARNLVFSGVEVRAHMVLTNENKDSLLEIAQNLSQLGVSELRLLRLVKAGRAEGRWQEISVNQLNLDEFFSAVFRDRSKFPLRVSLSGYPEIIPCRPVEGAKGCQAGTKLFFVTHAGEVFPCACTRNRPPFSLGHITETGKIRKHLEDQRFDYSEKCINKDVPS